MAKAPATKGSVINLFRRGPAADADEEVQIGPVGVAGGTRAARVALNLRDMTGRVPLALLAGRGQTGKSTFARWYGGNFAERGQGVMLASLDAGNRTLPRYFEGVQQPTEPNPEAPADPDRAIPSRNPMVMSRWFRELLDWEMANPTPAVIDLGGNDQTLPQQLEKTPGLVMALEEKGLGVVGLYFFGPRLDDLDALVTLESLGFQPAATALILNHGCVDTQQDPTEAFAAIRKHSRFRAAIDRGAVVLEMPRLEPDLAAAIEQKVLHFAQARDGAVPEGRRVAPIGGLDRAAVRAWMDRMQEAFGPLIDKGWLK